MISYDELSRTFMKLMSSKEHDFAINSLDSVYGGNIVISASQDSLYAMKLLLAFNFNCIYY